MNRHEKKINEFLIKLRNNKSVITYDGYYILIYPCECCGVSVLHFGIEGNYQNPILEYDIKNPKIFISIVDLINTISKSNFSHFEILTNLNQNKWKD